MKLAMDARQCAALVQAGKLDEAEEHCGRLLREQPGNAEALCVLGTLKYYRKAYKAAREVLEKAVRLDQGLLDARNVIGLTYLDGDRNIDAAMAWFQDIVRVDPRYTNAWINLGNACSAKRDYANAETYYKKALELDPDNFIVINNLGSLLVNSGRRPEGIEYYYRALALRPEDPDLLGNLTNFLMLERRRDEVHRLIPRILGLRAQGVAAFTAYNFCKFMVLWDEEAKLLPSVLSLIAQEKVEIASFESVNLALLASPDVSNERLFEIHRGAGRTLDRLRTAAPFTQFETTPPGRGKLRIGYLSPDFRAHSVNNFLRGIINAHDRERFEIFCYSSAAPEEQDAVTDQYRAAVDCFVDANPLSDADLARRIRDDGIHILVDLAGYTFRSRIGALCYRPAPVQLSYIGYPYTSGLETIDYFVSNALLDGPRNQRFFTERQLHLPESPFTFDSLTNQPIAPQPPFERNGHITFGTLNNPYKYSRQLIQLWARVLQAVPDARFIVNHPSCSFARTRENILEAFRQQGIEAERITLIHEKHPTGSHLHYYNDIDVSLDTFPLTGGTTTVDAVWMGVPVITLVGDIYHQRLSYSFLRNTGTQVDDLCAFTRDEYVSKATALAHKPDRIRALRRELPRNLRRSVLRDSLRLTRHIEAAYIEAWNRKFTDRPWSFAPQGADDCGRTAALPYAIDACIRDPLRDTDSYVLLEHEGWYDAEYEFVLAWARAGMNVVDIGAGLGAYALPLARRVGTQGRVWAATRYPHEARLIEAGCRRNGIGNLQLIARGDRKVFLDDDARDLDWPQIDLVRIDPVMSSQSLLECAESFFAERSPMVMFGSARVESYAKQEAVEPFFRQRGYGIYRYVPGLGMLAPVGADETLDSMTVNVFALRPARAAALAREGRLVRESQPLSRLPALDDPAWLEYLQAFPYAMRLRPGWKIDHDEWDDVYRIALILYAQAQAMDADAQSRYAALNAALSTLISLVQVAPSFPRRLSLARMLSDGGRREDAVTVLNGVLTLLESGAPIDVDEPFLALSARFAQMDPGDRMGDWTVASVLEELERLHAFSSWFTAADSLQRTDLLCATGFQSPAMERRRSLLRSRLGAGDPA